jgi:hypothetical protein
MQGQLGWTRPQCQAWAESVKDHDFPLPRLGLQASLKGQDKKQEGIGEAVLRLETC